MTGSALFIERIGQLDLDMMDLTIHWTLRKENRRGWYSGASKVIGTVSERRAPPQATDLSAISIWSEVLMAISTISAQEDPPLRPITPKELASEGPEARRGARPEVPLRTCLFAAYVKLIFNIGNHYRGGIVAGFISQYIGRRLTITVYVTQSSSHVSLVLTKKFQRHGPSPGR